MLRAAVLDIIGSKIGPEAAQIFQLSNQLLEDGSSELLSYELNRSAAELVNLYRNIEGLLSIETGIKSAGNQLLHVDEIMNSILVNKASHARRKGIQIQVAVEDRPLITRGQDYFVRVALENVVDNAIIYTRQGGQIFVLARKRLGSIVVEISDEGPGFSAEDCKNLFTRFKTLSARSSNAETQTGLGLYIAKELLSVMNAEIYLSLTGPDGSVFRLEFPFIHETV